MIIHGAGAVRAGMWARKLLLNDSMETGTCIPWIEDLLTAKYGVLLLSPNDNVYHIPSKSLHCNKLGRPKAGQRSLKYPCFQPKDGGPPIPIPGGGRHHDKFVLMKVRSYATINIHSFTPINLKKSGFRDTSTSCTVLLGKSCHGHRIVSKEKCTRCVSQLGRCFYDISVKT